MGHAYEPEFITATRVSYLHRGHSRVTRVPLTVSLTCMMPGYARLGFTWDGHSMRDFVMPENALVDGLKFRVYTRRLA